MTNESKVVMRQLGLQAWVSVKLEKHFVVFKMIARIGIHGVGMHASIHVMSPGVLHTEFCLRICLLVHDRPTESDISLSLSTEVP